MLKLEDLARGTIVNGLDPLGPSTIEHVEKLGDSAVRLIWKDSRGDLKERMLYRDDEETLSLAAKALPWTFDADGASLRLVSEAWRVHYAHLFDPYLAVHISEVQPLPHQISAVYQEMLERLPLRYVLADDPGAGKTIMTGLLIRELIARGELSRCLVVCPGGLADQWMEELFRKFRLRFELVTRERIESAATGNVFEEIGLAIARLDTLARDEKLLDKLRVADWDLIVCDEAHKMSAHVFGGEVKPTRRFELGKALSGVCRHFLLLTATPHNGKEEDFQLFLSLVDEDRFGGVAKTGARAIDASDIMRRLVKEDLLKFDGTPLFPDREAITLNYSLSPLEARLYEAVTAYVQSEFNRADNLAKKRKTTVGFALTVLQRRLASSSEAIYQSLKRRRERLRKRLEDERLGRRERDEDLAPPDDFDEDDLSAGEMEAMEEEIADRASASSSIRELEAEIETLEKLEKLAGELRASGRDRKWEELAKLLQEQDRMFDESGVREKLIVFTEHRDTLRYLIDKIRSLLGDDSAAISIYGGMSRDERRKAESLFKQDKGARVLVATDAAGEGLNLQRAHLMINYDLPWNPNRLEQRFGRVHRIGQEKTCYLWNLVASETREGAVFERLFRKLELEKAALGGKVFDILGKVSFDNRPLRELLIEAVRGEGKKKNSAILRRVDESLDREALKALMAERALVDDVMSPGIVAEMREQMERMEARRLQPHFIEAFFKEAFRRLGGKIVAREEGRFEITYVPAILRARDRLIGGRDPVLTRYERVCFEKARLASGNSVELLCPGHPLLEAVLDVTREREGDSLKRGAILIDEEDPGEKARLLFYIESVIQDGTTLPNGRSREISRQIQFVELTRDGGSVNAGLAPYLDYRPASGEEREILLEYVARQDWLKEDLERRAIDFAALELVPRHLKETRERKIALIDKIEKESRQRLTAQIQYWDARARDLRLKENAGKRNAAQNAVQAQNRAENLEARLNRRMAELAAERQISARPPLITGGCLVIPRGLLNKLMPGEAADDLSVDPESRKKVENAAMAAVMAIERELGFEPRDVSADKLGYDIESRVPESMRSKSDPAFRFIEVKGRSRGAKKVMVTRGEILFALTNPEQFYLALVEVDGESASAVYLKKPFQNPPDWSEDVSGRDIRKLRESAETVLTREF